MLSKTKYGKTFNRADVDDYDEEDGDYIPPSWVYSGLSSHIHRGAWSGVLSELMSSRKIHHISKVVHPTTSSQQKHYWRIHVCRDMDTQQHTDPLWASGSFHSWIHQQGWHQYFLLLIKIIIGLIATLAFLFNLDFCCWLRTDYGYSCLNIFLALLTDWIQVPAYTPIGGKYKTLHLFLQLNKEAINIFWIIHYL